MVYGKLYGGPTTPQHEGYAVTGKAPQDGETDAFSTLRPPVNNPSDFRAGNGDLSRVRFFAPRLKNGKALSENVSAVS
jgi:hypothetical protein